MATQYIGFSGDQLKQIMRANVQMGCAVQYALDTAFFNDGLFTRTLEQYIGPSKKNQSRVMGILNSMILTIRGGTYDIACVEPDGSTLASAQKFAGVKTKGGYIGGTTKGAYHEPYVGRVQTFEKRAGKKLLIKIMPSFFGLPFKAKDVDTQIETLIHELSHHAAGTEDIVLEGKTCYGLDGVRRAKQGGKGANNADNIGYFVASFMNFS